MCRELAGANDLVVEMAQILQSADLLPTSWKRLYTDAFHDRRRSRRQNECSGGRDSMMQSIFCVQTWIAFQTANHEDVMRPLRPATTLGGTRPGPSATSRAKLSKYSSLLTKNFGVRVPSGARATNQPVGLLQTV